ncbi:MAG: M15 family metallopeptidase, partial [Polyangiaceae bacterium]
PAAVCAFAGVDAGADAGASALAETATLAAATVPTEAAPPTEASPAPLQSACNDQSPQDFLVRGNFLKDGPDGNRRAIQYRTDQYGYFKGYGKPGPDARPPSASLVDATFMGLKIKMHRKVAPALACVEEEIKRACVEHPYVAHALAGIRYKNTYRGGEVTNHAYGIAIDVDPAINTCCGCVKPWNDAPACKRPAKTEYDRMAMPECWVHAFERFGFYWLGHDVLRDTMHFEFLGDPDRILRTPGALPSPPSAPSGPERLSPDGGS